MEYVHTKERVLMSDLLNRHLTEVINKSWNFAGRCKTLEDEITNCVMGLAGEAGEVTDLHKKMFFHTPKEGYRDKLRHELGDIYFYLLKLQDLYGFTTEEIIQANREKLESRHPELGVVKERFAGDYIR